MHPRAMSFPFDKHLVDVWVLSQYVKDHFCIVEVVAMDVGSLSLQVSGIGYAPDSFIQTLRAIPAIDVDGSPRVSLNGCNTRTQSFCRFCTTASLGVSCSPRWLVATISSNVKFLLSRIFLFNRNYHELNMNFSLIIFE